MSLRLQAISGVKWIGIARVIRLAISLSTTAVLAHLLSPADFGLMGMVVVITAFAFLVGDLGIPAAVIHKPEVTPELLSSAFWATIIIAALAAVIIAVSAPHLATFYREPKLTPILLVSSLGLVINSFGVIHRTLLERALLFDRIAVIEVAATLIGSALAIVVAIFGGGVWSLVCWTLANVFVTSISLWFFGTWKPSYKFVWAELRIITSFSMNFTGFQIINYLTRNIDNLLIGRYLGAEALGYYDMAYRLILYPMQLIPQLIARVLFPLLSKIQDENQRFKNVFLKVSGVIALITFPIYSGVWVTAEPVVLTVLGSHWSPVILLLLILAPIGAIQSVLVMTAEIYKAKGRTDIQFRWGIFQSVVLIFGIVTGLQWGIVGVACGYSIAFLIILYPAMRIVFSLIDLPVGQFLRVLSRPASAAFVMMIAIAAISFLLPENFRNLWTLFLLVPFGIIAYCALVYWFDRRRIHDLWAAIMNT